MIISFIIAIILGLIAGTITGLTPGLHINLVSAALITYADKINETPFALVIFIVSMSITHTFLDFIPSVFLGAPDEDTFLAILPGHEMLREGKGHEAVLLSIIGSIIGTFLIILFSPIIIFAIPLIYTLISSLIPFILIFISLYVTAREENFLLSLIVFITSGFLGIFSFMLPNNQPILPLLGGLFGLSSLIISFKNNSSIPKQQITKIKDMKIERKDILRSILPAMIVSPALSFLPGIGSGHSAFISSEIIKQTRKSFIILIGAINTIVMASSFIALYTINKTRSGSALAVKEILGKISEQNLIIILLVIIISGICASLITLEISKRFAIFIKKIDYRFLNLIIIMIISVLTLIFSGINGILILITSAALGIFAITSNVRRINLMGCLIIPTILFYLFG